MLRHYFTDDGTCYGCHVCVDDLIDKTEADLCFDAVLGVVTLVSAKTIAEGIDADFVRYMKNLVDNTTGK